MDQKNAWAHIVLEIPKKILYNGKKDVKCDRKHVLSFESVLSAKIVSYFRMEWTVEFAWELVSVEWDW